MPRNTAGLTNYTCGITVEARSALEQLATDEWSAVETDASDDESVFPPFRCGAVRFRGRSNVVLRARPVDIARKVEVVTFHACVDTQDKSHDRRFRQPQYRSLGALVEPLLGKRHHILVGRRTLSAPGWEQSGVGDILLDDVLVLRGPDGYEVVVAPDDDEIGRLIVANDWQALPSAGAPLVDLTML